ncbi:hypothetical protein ACFT79_34090, partial [[Kitasatospora] papulosa]
MSVWWRSRDQAAERRPQRDGGMSLDQVLSLFKTSRSYADVDLSRAESSLQAVAVWAACDLIASIISELPVGVFRGEGEDARKLPKLPGWLEDPDGSGHGLADWRYQAMMSWL